MNQIFLDPRALPFTPNGTINLHTLKKDIDRRLSKIRNLIGLSQMTYNPISHKQFVHTACQTGDKQNESIVNKTKHRRALSSQQPNHLTQENQNNNYRCSLANSRNQKNKEGNQREETNDCNVRIRVSDYLSSGKKQICKKNHFKGVEIVANESQDEMEKIEFQNSQDDKIFKSIEFQLLTSFKSTRSLQQEAPICTYIISQSVSGEPSSSQCESTNSQEQEERRSFSAINQRQTSTKKIRYTDRTAIAQTKRIIVSEECSLRMNQMITQQVVKNRKQPGDCKLRSNLIKKIEQKYGEYYENN